METKIDAYIDFNEVDPAGLVSTRSKYTTTSVGVGDVVMVGDHDGMTAKGHVTKVTTSGWISIQLDAPFRRVEGLVGASTLFA